MSRAPWLYALALWPHGSRWGGGGRFRGKRDVVLWSSRAIQPHPDHRPRGLKVAFEREAHTDLFERAAGTDHEGNLIRVAQGALYRTRRGREDLVVDLNGIEPDPQAAPPWARTPLTAGYAGPPRRSRRRG